MTASDLSGAAKKKMSQHHLSSSTTTLYNLWAPLQCPQELKPLPRRYRDDIDEAELLLTCSVYWQFSALLSTSVTFTSSATIRCMVWYRISFDATMYLPFTLCYQSIPSYAPLLYGIWCMVWYDTILYDTHGIVSYDIVPYHRRR